MDLLRNTRQIYSCFGPLAPSRMQARSRTAWTWVRPESTDKALGVADDQVESLLEDGWDPAKVCLLTTGHRHPVQR